MMKSFVQLVVSTIFLFLMVLCGYVFNIKQKLAKKLWAEAFELLVPMDTVGYREKPHDIVTWYSKQNGYDVEEYKINTADNFILHLQRLRKEGTANTSPRGPPIILQHGLFQSSGIFVVAHKKKSLAFYLSDLGYDVWLGNNRGVFDSHSELTKKDLKYWDWNIHHLGVYDFSAIVKFVHKTTSLKVTFIGHSQGNAQAFAGLSCDPSLSKEIELFIAMAPAYYINDFKHWSLKLLQKTPEKYFEMIFGNTTFIPIMHPCQSYLHQRVFSSFAYTMFAYLFGWTSDKWKKGLKPAIFQTSPRPISTKLIRNWLDVTKSGVLKSLEYGLDNSSKEVSYKLNNIKCPIAVIWGKGDSLVDGGKLVEELKTLPVKLVYDLGIDDYEHMDLIWAKDAVGKVFHPLKNLLLQHNSILKQQTPQIKSDI